MSYETKELQFTVTKTKIKDKDDRGIAERIEFITDEVPTDEIICNPVVEKEKEKNGLTKVVEEEPKIDELPEDVLEIATTDKEEVTVKAQVTATDEEETTYFIHPDSLNQVELMLLVDDSEEVKE